MIAVEHVLFIWKHEHQGVGTSRKVPVQVSHANTVNDQEVDKYTSERQEDKAINREDKAMSTPFGDI